MTGHRKLRQACVGYFFKIVIELRGRTVFGSVDAKTGLRIRRRAGSEARPRRLGFSAREVETS